MTTANDIIRIAKSYEGTREHPPGSNHVPGITDWFGADDSWCFMFVSRVFDKAGALDLIHGQHGYVPDFHSIFAPHDEFHTSNPKPGDLVAFDFNRSGEPEHIGIVLRVISSTLIETIEGNTSGSGGDGVYIKTRRRSDVYAYATPKYSNSPSSPAPSTPEDDDFMAEYVSIDKNDKSRHEVLENGKWTQVYFNKNNSAASKAHHAAGDYPSVVQGGHHYTGAVNLRITGLPGGVAGQIRCVYTDAKTSAVKNTCYISEFVGTSGDTFVTHPAVGYVPTGQKLRVEVTYSGSDAAKPQVIEGYVRLFVK